MEIFAHRGAWTAREERNTLPALERAWKAGYGVETDLRDLDGTVVVSHDPPRSADPQLYSLEDLLHRWDAAGRPGRLALNVKADGLATAVAATLAAFAATPRAFVFDMSVPDQRSYLDAGVPLLARWSDVEPPVRPPGSAGFWLDAFAVDDWWDADAVRRHLDDGGELVLVSPELHGRPERATWQRVAGLGLHRHPGFGLCTDFPDAAEEFFA